MAAPAPTGRISADVSHSRDKPLLFVDIDGVVSLFGLESSADAPRCSWHQVDGMLHLLSHGAAAHLQLLANVYEPVWCSGWEDRANDHLPHVLGLGPFPYLTFARDRTAGHWKLPAVQARAGDARPLAWIDDDVNDAVHAWAAARPAPTLIVETRPDRGLTDELAERLRRWGTLARAGEVPSASD